VHTCEINSTVFSIHWSWYLKGYNIVNGLAIQSTCRSVYLCICNSNYFQMILHLTKVNKQSATRVQNYYRWTCLALWYLARHFLLLTVIEVSGWKCRSCCPTSESQCYGYQLSIAGVLMEPTFTSTKKWSHYMVHTVLPTKPTRSASHIQFTW